MGLSHHCYAWYQAVSSANGMYQNQPWRLPSQSLHRNLIWRSGRANSPLDKWFSNSLYISMPWGLVKTQIIGPHPRVYDSVHLGWGLKMSISNKFPGDAYAAGPGTTFENPWLRYYHILTNTWSLERGRKDKGRSSEFCGWVLWAHCPQGWDWDLGPWTLTDVLGLDCQVTEMRTACCWLCHLCTLSFLCRPQTPAPEAKEPICSPSPNPKLHLEKEALEIHHHHLRPYPPTFPYGLMMYGTPHQWALLGVPWACKIWTNTGTKLVCVCVSGGGVGVVAASIWISVMILQIKKEKRNNPKKRAKEQTLHQRGNPGANRHWRGVQHHPQSGKYRFKMQVIQQPCLDGANEKDGAWQEMLTCCWCEST